jgi:Tfp pilus assembly protein FimV
MPKLTACVGLLALLATSAFAQNRDPRVDELTKQTAELKRHIADQDEKIAELEKAVKALQTAAAPPMPARIPIETPAWYHAANWTQIKTGMSEAQVTSILGPPTSVDSSIDKRTLNYAPDAHSTVTLKGSVTLVDDRVSAMIPPAF